MNFDLLHDAHFHRNRILRAGSQLLTAAPSDSVLGEFGFFDSGAPAASRLHLAVCDNSGTNLWALLAGINRAETIAGLWVWNPAPRAPATGSRAPFVLGTDSSFEPGTILSNQVAGLNAEYHGGRKVLEYAISAPSTGFVPVYGGSGQIAVADPVNEYDAVNRRTWSAGLTGMVVLAPCRVASVVRLAGVRAGNVITASSPGALVVDGVSVIAGNRILLKDQQTGGTAVDNGPYSVTNAGAAGVNWILTRTTDADATGELTVGALVYIEEGTTNRATQWSCQKLSGQTGNVIDINVEGNVWQKSFQQSAYIAGRGLVLNGLEFNFSQNSDYTVGTLFTATGARTVAPLASPSAKRWLSHPGTAATQPAWAQIAVADITDFPNVVTSPGTGTVGRHTRWATGTRTLENSNLEDFTTGVVGAGNTLAGATVGLGWDDKPFKDAWLNLLRLAPITGTPGQVSGLLGFEGATADPNANHKRVVGWTATDVKGWLGITASDVGAVPTTRTLTIAGTAGQVSVSPIGAQDLSASRSWLVSLDFASLDSRWVTLNTAQTLAGTKTWQSASSDPSEAMVRLRTSGASAIAWQVTAGGTVSWGDGVAPPVASLDFSNDRLRVSGKPFWFDTTAPVRISSALPTGPAPVTVLGLTVNDDVQEIAAADLWTWLGQPTLAAGAVGFGNAGNRLSGNANLFTWDAINNRLGINVAAPSVALDVLGASLLTNNVTTGTYPGSRAVITDTSNNSADWTLRNLIGSLVRTVKAGTAAFVTTGAITSLRSELVLAGGSVTYAAGIVSVVAPGGAAIPASATSLYAFLSSPLGAAGSLGTIGTFAHFQVLAPAPPFPQASEHYGFRCADLPSVTGATITAGVRIDMSGPGVGTRYALYASSTANSFFGGPIGLGVTDPTGARLYLGVGTATQAPMRFAGSSSSSSLLTSPVGGAFESSGDRLHFTTATPTRRGLAFIDEIGFTNDPNAAQAGGVVLTPTDRVSASLTAAGYTEDIGSDPFSLWVRFRVPTAFRGPNADSIAGIGPTSTSGVNNGCILWIDSVGAFKLTFYGVSGGNSRFGTATGFRTSYGGAIVDVVLVRNGSAIPTVYCNGQPLTFTESTTGTPPAWDNDLDAQYLIVGNTTASNGAVARIHRAVLFNRPLSQSEAGDLSRFGISVLDQWGSTKATITDNFDSGLSGWVATEGANNTLVAAQTVNGSAAWATNTRTNSTGRSDLSRQNTGASIGKSWGLRYRVWRTTAQPSFFGCSVGLSAGASSKTAVAGSTETEVFVFCSAPSQNTTPAIRIEPGTTAAAGNADVTIPAGSVFSVQAPTVYQVGVLVDLDLAIGCGSAFPDRSGRYHGVASGTGLTHYIPTCPVELPSGPGTIARGLRRYTQTITAKDGDTVSVTHGLGTQNLTVAVWDQAGAAVQVAVQRKPGAETTALEIGFSLVGSPSVAIPFLVVITG